MCHLGSNPGLYLDCPLFQDTEREPDEVLRLQIRALATMPLEENERARGMLQAIILKSQVAGAVKQFGSTPAATEPAAQATTDQGKKPAARVPA